MERDIDAVDELDAPVGQIEDGSAVFDDEAQAVALEAGDESFATTAEEAAMHVTEAPPMGDGDGYLEEDG